MNKFKLNKVISDGNIVIPLYILKFYKKLNLTMDEFVFLMYLYNKQDNLDFNPEKIALDMNLDIMEVMGYVSVLTDKGYISLDVIKTENNILEEVLNLSNFYERISTFLINSEDPKTNFEENILKFTEHELGRPLSSTEISTINGWINNKIDESLIKEAISLALKDGVYSLKYIDKILVDWSSRGFHSVSDLYTQEKQEEVKEEIELDDWNWLDDEEEYIVN